MRRASGHKGGNFSTAYSRNYIEYEGQQVPAAWYYDERSHFWHQKAAGVTLILWDRLGHDNAKMEEFWATVDDHATSKQIYERINAELWAKYREVADAH